MPLSFSHRGGLPIDVLKWYYNSFVLESKQRNSHILHYTEFNWYPVFRYFIYYKDKFVRKSWLQFNRNNGKRWYFCFWCPENWKSLMLVKLELTHDSKYWEYDIVFFPFSAFYYWYNLLCFLHVDNLRVNYCMCGPHSSLQTGARL